MNPVSVTAAYEAHTRSSAALKDEPLSKDQNQMQVTFEIPEPKAAPAIYRNPDILTDNIIEFSNSNGRLTRKRLSVLACKSTLENINPNMKVDVLQEQFENMKIDSSKQIAKKGILKKTNRTARHDSDDDKKDDHKAVETAPKPQRDPPKSSYASASVQSLTKELQNRGISFSSKARKQELIFELVFDDINSDFSTQQLREELGERKVPVAPEAEKPELVQKAIFESWTRKALRNELTGLGIAFSSSARKHELIEKLRLSPPYSKFNRTTSKKKVRFKILKGPKQKAVGMDLEEPKLKNFGLNKSTPNYSSVGTEESDTRPVRSEEPEPKHFDLEQEESSLGRKDCIVAEWKDPGMDYNGCTVAELKGALRYEGWTFPSKAPKKELVARAHFVDLHCDWTIEQYRKALAYFGVPYSMEGGKGDLMELLFSKCRDGVWV